MPAVINHDDNDDAESCSCEYDTTSDLLHMVIELNYSLDDDANVGDDDEEDGEVVDQEVRLYKKCRYDPCINGRVAKESKKSSVDSTETMNEMEKNSQFAYHLYMLIRLPVWNKVHDNLPRNPLHHLFSRQNSDSCRLNNFFGLE
ncbi:hypothetical protein V6N13_079520 [Hibiscus sabdariffa]|uniref:Uncharacterized protein n=1 Tax=Hibiscus sabdariffa TaxID=183260 RepID=A0ABR2RRP4_9ROSI